MHRIVAFALALAAVIPGLPAQADEISSRQYWLADYGFIRAWQLSRGEGVRVAIIDTGVDATHPALSGKVVAAKDFSNTAGANGVVPVGENSHHGTMVASLIAGEADSNNPQSGFLGTAWEADLISASVNFNDDSDDQIAQAIIWSVDQGARVINLSLTRNTTSWPKVWDDAFLYAFDNDVVIVAAVGNSSDGTAAISAPATIPGVVAVAGLDIEGKLSSDSSSSGFEVTVAAAGEDLVSAYPDNQYRIWSGSSAAAAIVSGQIALIRSLYPKLDAANVINRLIRSARKPLDESGYGYGVIDAYRSLTIELAAVSENPLGNLREWIELYRANEQESAGVVSAPIQSKALPIEAATSAGELSYLPIAGYAGVGLVALVMYLLFRPSSKPRKDKGK